MANEIDDVSRDAVEINYELERINDKVRNIERIAGTIESLADSGLKSWDKYLQQKNEREKRESELKRQVHEKEIEAEDKKHKRAVFILGCSIFVVFILLLTAMIIGQFELVKVILSSTLGVAGGAGVASMFKKSRGS